MDTQNAARNCNFGRSTQREYSADATFDCRCSNPNARPIIVTLVI
jgi:hypothetical protein